MREFFALCAPYELNTINAVGILMPASIARLTTAEKYIHHAITELFGKDIEKNFVLLVSFYDGGEPAAYQTMRNTKIDFQSRHTLNNGALFDCTTDHVQKMLWELGFNGIKAFLHFLDAMSPVNLALTKQVLAERSTLAENLKVLQDQIPQG